MNIIDIKILDDTLVINIEQGTDGSSIDKVYIDTLDNEQNKYAEEDNKHTYVINKFETTDNLVHIELDELVPELDRSAFTVSINGTVGFYFDKQELYYKQIDLLTNYCSTCLDKHQKELMVLFLLKQNLLEYAVSNNLLEDQISYYKDLARMLHIDLKHNAQQTSIKCCANKEKCCINGICTLC